ncbi:uncharacterized protein FFFS_11964 [Fusarium fujikuroi]|nr:uncharacterized protein FFFS_11964 [Fusarium fujikuroi]
MGFVNIVLPNSAEDSD